MELGEKLRQARLEAGMSQRQLCGNDITRNMLSLIEHGSAKPSMKTLQILASRLGKTVGYFLEEQPLLSPNQDLLLSARRLYGQGDFAGAALVLEAWEAPDALFEPEKELLWFLSHLKLAQRALEEGREPYALSLLEKAGKEPALCSVELGRKKLLLLGRLPGQQVAARLPSLDEELLLRAEEALDAAPDRAACLLEAAEDRELPQWKLLRGKAHLALEEYAQAAACLGAVEDIFPQALPLLELCCRELGDYRLAYEYACKQRSHAKQL